MSRNGNVTIILCVTLITNILLMKVNWNQLETSVERNLLEIQIKSLTLMNFGK